MKKLLKEYKAVISWFTMGLYELIVIVCSLYEGDVSLFFWGTCALLLMSIFVFIMYKLGIYQQTEVPLSNIDNTPPEKSKYLRDVEEFHKTFNHPVNEVTDDIDLKTRQLRVKLLFEELEELSEASDVKGTFNDLCLDSIGKHKKTSDIKDGDNVDKVEELDALGDIQYVLSGAVLALGHHEHFDDAFQNIQDSNMSKMCSSTIEAESTMDHYEEQGVETYFVEKDGKYIVLRKSDDKVLKNIHYTQTDLKQFIKKDKN